MKKFKIFCNFKMIYSISLIYFFVGYFYPNLLQINNVYAYIAEYFGIYERMLWIFLIGYGFSIFMKNPNKRVVLKTRLIFMIILGISTGYLYLLENLKELNEITIDTVEHFVINLGLLNINLGYIELYTFLKIYPLIESKLFTGYLIGIIFISLLIICGKIIKSSIMLVINFFKRRIEKRKKERKEKKEREILQKQAELEKEIYNEICDIQKKYGEKDYVEESLERNKKNDISIEISEKETDTGTAGI
ncbi:MAG: hypothetical protein ACRCZO_01225 [Cetobacterium sp.]